MPQQPNAPPAPPGQRAARCRAAPGRPSAHRPARERGCASAGPRCQAPAARAAAGTGTAWRGRAPGQGEGKGGQGGSNSKRQLRLPPCPCCMPPADAVGRVQPDASSAGATPTPPITHSTQPAPTPKHPACPTSSSLSCSVRLSSSRTRSRSSGQAAPKRASADSAAARTCTHRAAVVSRWLQVGHRPGKAKNTMAGAYASLPRMAERHSTLRALACTQCSSAHRRILEDHAVVDVADVAGCRHRVTEARGGSAIAALCNGVVRPGTAGSPAAENLLPPSHPAPPTHCGQPYFLLTWVLGGGPLLAQQVQDLHAQVCELAILGGEGSGPGHGIVIRCNGVGRGRCAIDE